jgi:hypothetical protein
METNDLTESELVIIKLLRNGKPGQLLQIMIDLEGRPGVYVISESSKRIVFPNKTVYQEVSAKFHLN